MRNLDAVARNSKTPWYRWFALWLSRLKMLVVETSSSVYTVNNVERWDADALIKELFVNGKLGASGYRASLVMMSK